jgi:phosphate transport system substrate-binding protein
MKYLCLTLLTGALGCTRPSGDNTILIKGSDTEVNLALNLAERYMEVDDSVSIAITGGGSGTGFASLINKRADIANSSRPITDKEMELAREQGVEPYGTVFALDGLALIVNESLPVKTLTVKQVGTIYRGDVTNWSALGGPDVEISAYGRQSSSGTYLFFRDSVLYGDYSENVRRMSGTAQIVEAVRSDRSAIGYVGIGYIQKKDGSVVGGIRPVSISPGGSEKPLSPLVAGNINSGRYPLTRPLFQYTNGKPSGKTAEFIAFTLSDAGQQIVATEGYYRIPERYKNPDLAYESAQTK